MSSDPGARRPSTSSPSFLDLGVPRGPSADRPDDEFLCEHGTARVSVGRSWKPIWWEVATIRNQNSGPGGLLVSMVAWLFGLLPVLLWRRVRRLDDHRWRVAVLRGRGGYPALLRPVQIEFFDTKADAEARRVEILTDWATVDWDTKRVISVRERRRLRDESSPNATD